MRNLKTAAVSAAMALALVAALGVNAVSATSTINKLFDYSSILAPGQPMPTPAPEPVIEEPQRYRNPYMSYEPFRYVKGGVRYADFAGLPDFGQYAQMGGDRVVVYPPTENSFYFIGAPEITYTYRSKIIDYIGVGASTVKAYKAHIKSLGFVEKKALASEAFREYVEIIEWQVRYDANFAPDADGVFVVEDLETFRWLLIGKSICYDADGNLVPCVEFRFYSLTRTDNYKLSIMYEVGNLENPEGAGLETYLFITPDALRDITDAGEAPEQGFGTPDALKDMGNTGAVTEGMYTPDATDDIRAIANAPQVPGFTAPEAVSDIGGVIDLLTSG